MNFLEDFIKKESSSGIILIIVTILALFLSNTFLSPIYEYLLHIPLEIKLGPLFIGKSLYHWINDGLMSLFFLLVGLEVKREIVEGSLSTISQATLPVIAAIGGMLIPAGIYILLNINSGETLNGWAIPMATDIAFALGILALIGKRIPSSLKTFLLALAIIDDLGAIIIIALFYTSNLSKTSLLFAGIFIILLIILNRFKITRKAPYFIVGLFLWISVLKSGIHATLAGVILAFTIPLKVKTNDGNIKELAKEIEHDLHYWVAFLILPLFAFVNAGVKLTNVSTSQLFSPLSLGIIIGLFIGKQVGVFGFSFIAVKTNIAKLPEKSSWKQFYGMSVLTGIGFTMSLFIASLAFTDENSILYTDKLAILIASFLSGTFGYLILKFGKQTD